MARPRIRVNAPSLKVNVDKVALEVAIRKQKEKEHWDTLHLPKIKEIMRITECTWEEAKALFKKQLNAQLIGSSVARELNNLEG